ncbi:MAG: helix-turn-helix domain-containing protein [Clostridia bacterium]|nr:helix-turn-helix domain-containing protein [Clostridia bacterium]
MTMRQEYEKILGEELRYLAIKTRERLHLTQREMGARLQMGEGSYSDIETGRTTCGALTEALLLSMQEDPKLFLDHVTKKFTRQYEKEMQLT